MGVFELQEPYPVYEIFLHQTQHMEINQDIKIFVGAGTAAVHKDMKQIHDCRVSITVDPNKFPMGYRRAALKYLMFLKQNRDSSVKVRGCADGRPQHTYTSKYKSSLPTFYTEWLMMYCFIDAKEGYKVAMVAPWSLRVALHA